MKLGEYAVFLVEKFAFRKRDKDRTVIAVAVSDKGGHLTVFPTTTQKELSEGENCFEISADDPQFKETGLRYTSFVIDEVADVHKSRVVKRFGVIRGDLKKRLDKHLGIG